MVENLAVSHLEESEPNHHVVRVGWSVDSTTYQLGMAAKHFLKFHYFVPKNNVHYYMNCVPLKVKIHFRMGMEVQRKFLRIANSRTMGCLSS